MSSKNYSLSRIEDFSSASCLLERSRKDLSRRLTCAFRSCFSSNSFWFCTLSPLYLEIDTTFCFDSSEACRSSGSAFRAAPRAIDMRLEGFAIIRFVWCLWVSVSSAVMSAICSFRSALSYSSCSHWLTCYSTSYSSLALSSSTRAFRFSQSAISFSKDSFVR